jgi:small-conductance mechanosensitive channel
MTNDLGELSATLLAALPGLLRALVIIALAFPAAVVLSRLIYRSAGGIASPERAMLARRVGFWGIIGMAVASAMRELGFDLSVVVGAAGVFTVAVGFASQTSASNVISGLFLIGEQPFSVGDSIRIGTTEGEVIAIDLLSVKLRTSANLYVRVPNESVMKSEITNMTRFPIRRIDVRLTLPYDTDINVARRTLLHAIDEHILTLTEPQPAVRFAGYTETGMTFVASAWATREACGEVGETLPLDIKAALDGIGVSLLLPQRRITSLVSAPAAAELHIGDGE